MTAAAATSDPRATDAAAAVLRAGGNAVDAAVTAAFVLYVVEPQSCGIGGDGFMFVHRARGAPHALGGSGSVPRGLTPSALAADGLDNVPARGAKTVTPPGAVRLLEDALDRYGTISLAAAIAPARDLAREGFSVRSTLAVAARSAQKNSPDVPPIRYSVRCTGPAATRSPKARPSSTTPSPMRSRCSPRRAPRRCGRERWPRRSPPRSRSTAAISPVRISPNTPPRSSHLLRSTSPGTPCGRCRPPPRVQRCWRHFGTSMCRTRSNGPRSSK